MVEPEGGDCMNTFPKNLSRLRKAAGLKQEELAEKLNVTRQTVSGWETGRRQPDLETLKELAAALDADIHELIFGDKPETYPKFQRRYVAASLVCGVVLLFYLMFRIFLQRLVTASCNSYYLSYPRMIILFGLPILALFAGGLLMPSLLALYTPVKLSQKAERYSLILGIGLGLIPLFLLFSTVFGFYGAPFYQAWRLTFSDWGRALIIYVLPFFSGLLLGLGYLSKTET